MQASHSPRHPLRVPAAFALVQLLRLALALRISEPRLAATLPDDAFYYLQLARNFATSGRWSFDGVEPATGFHLLWGYLLAAMYRVHPGLGLHVVVAIASLAGIACMTVAAWLCVRTAEYVFGPGADLGVGVIFLSTLSLEVGGYLMEMPWLILVSAALVFSMSGLTHRRVRDEWGIRALFIATFLGWSGVMARSDFGLLPLALCLVCGLLRKQDRPRFHRSAAALAGAFLGQATLALHTHRISGNWVQASARQKLFWSHLQGFSFRPVTTLLLEYFNNNTVQNGFSPRKLWIARLLLLALLTGIAAALRRRNAWLPAAMLAVVAGYLSLYRFNSADLQPWYCAEFQVPLALLAAASFARLPQRSSTCLGIALCTWGIVASIPWHPIPPSSFYLTGVYLRQHPELRPAASWNAGMIGYISGGGVANLDGLVNDRIYPHAVANTTLDYVRQRQIKTILDFPTMVDPAAMRREGPPNLARRNGYGDGQLQSCLHLQTMVGSMAAYQVHCTAP